MNDDDKFIDEDDDYDYLEENFVKLDGDNNNGETDDNGQIIDHQRTSDSRIVQDKMTLEEMGFDKTLIEKIYSTVYPTSLDDALDYLQTDDNGKFTHSFVANNIGICSICGKSRSLHANESAIDNIIQDGNNDNVGGTNNTNTNLFDTNNNILSNNNILNNMLNSYKNPPKPYNNYYNSSINKECMVCSEEIDSTQLNKIKLPCKHCFCVDCWVEYLKEKINNANVYKLTCMEHKCGYILEEKFIKSLIGDDKPLVEKYEKFLKRKKAMDTDKKIRFCPFPDCDGYAEKKKGKYVMCNNNHEFCFECGQAPHGKKKCEKVIDEGFEEWKKNTLVKRCPYCKFWTEKNEGCNHMTCSQCNFQWCWVCEKECVAGHYSFGPCKGLHFETVRSQQMARELLKDNCDACCVVSCILTQIVYLLIYFFMMPCFYLAVMGKKYLEEIDDGPLFFFFCISFLPFFICYEIWSICYIAIATIPAIFVWPYFRFLRYILFGKILGELFPV